MQRLELLTVGRDRKPLSIHLAFTCHFLIVANHDVLVWCQLTRCSLQNCHQIPLADILRRAYVELRSFVKTYQLRWRLRTFSEV